MIDDNRSAMFTGIVEEIGHVRSIRRGTKSITLEIEAAKVLENTQVGDSICTNGVCLTVTAMKDGAYCADVMPETVRMTSLAALVKGSEVNLERALTLNTRLGGHLVSGHVDGTATVARRSQDDNAIWLWMDCKPELMRYIVQKGSVTVQGISLTVAKVTDGSFAVSLIPHTQSATTLHNAKVGDVVNIETDIIARYVEKLMNGHSATEDKIELYRSFMKK